MTPSNWSIHTQENTERKIRVEVKSQFLQNLSRLKGHRRSHQTGEDIDQRMAR